MSWHGTARGAAQRLGLDPRYLRRLRWISKARAVSSTGAPLHTNLSFVFADPEPHNFTYDLANEDALAGWVQAVSGADAGEIQRVLGEPRDDGVLQDRLGAATRRHWWWSKAAPPFGKRLGWYALARLIRPAAIIEAGVHDGLGSLILLRALERNAEDGAEGRLTSFDINPAAGWLAGPDSRWELRIQATRDGLEGVLAVSPPVGIFIHDSLHTYDNELWELRTVAPALAPGGVLISDNVHATPALAETCAEFGLAYSEFVERPAAHFYPGGAMGAGRRALS